MIIPHIQTIVDQLKIHNWKSDSETVQVSREGLKQFLQCMAATIEFDELFYLETYTDVKKAVKSGKFKSGRDHYVSYGVLEGRIPSLKQFNYKDYLKHYDDVAEYAANDRNKKKKAIQHFVEFGFAEGRDVELVNRLDGTNL